MSKKWGPKGGELIKGSRCPKCNNECEYNGNYWCSTCSWVLPHYENGTSGKYEETFKILYVLLMKQRGLEPDIDVIRR